MAPQYHPETYWDGLVGRTFDLRAVGYPELSLEFNQCLYEAMVDSVERGLERWALAPGWLEKAEVLDVGSGVGFWIDFWMRRGAGGITGIDLTQPSVQRLGAKYPSARFHQADAAEPRPEWNARFDMISAMSILNHIAVQSRWTQALLNLGAMLRPGGRLIVMDPILNHSWKGKPFDPAMHGRARLVSEHAEVLARQGVRIDFVLPTAVLLANPVDARSRAGYRALELGWSVTHRIARREWSMRAARPALYALDRWLARRQVMPSSKLLFCSKEA